MEFIVVSIDARRSFSYVGDYVYLYILLEVIREIKLVGVVSMELK